MTPGTIGQRVWLYGPHYWNDDMSLTKHFAITERVKFQLRLNAFNVLNHPQFGTVPFEYDTGATDPTFGTYSKLAGNNPLAI